MPDKFLIIVFLLPLTKQTARFVDGSSNNSTLKYNKLSFSIYEPGWSLRNDGALEVWFKTGMKNAMLVYEDDDGDQGEFFDVFLVAGRIQMRMTVGDCYLEERVVNGSFNDYQWHKLVIRKERKNVTLSVDSFAAEPFQCSSQEDFMTALYTGYLSLVENPTKYWVFPTSRWESTLPIFQGCIKDIQYTEGGIVTKPQLRTTRRTEHGCSSPCKSLKCRHGGRCVDRIMTAWCNCDGTGYHGKHCARAIKKTSTKPPTITTPSPSTKKIVSREKDEIQATLSPKEKQVFKSQRKSLGVCHGVGVLIVTIITVLGLSITACNVV